mgnify:CR=1 FL=1
MHIALVGSITTTTTIICMLGNSILTIKLLLWLLWCILLLLLLVLRWWLSLLLSLSLNVFYIHHLGEFFFQLLLLFLFSKLCIPFLNSTCSLKKLTKIKRLLPFWLSNCWNFLLHKLILKLILGGRKMNFG